jgi:hypothetical protein
MLGRRDEARDLLLKHINANPQWSQYEPMRRVAKELGIQAAIETVWPESFRGLQREHRCPLRLVIRAH